MKRYRKSPSIFVKLMLWLIALAMTTACTEDSLYPYDIDTTEWERFKVAVVVPLSGDDSHRMRVERIYDYFEENAIRAQQRQKSVTLS